MRERVGGALLALTGKSPLDGHYVEMLINMTLQGYHNAILRVCISATIIRITFLLD
mgnify:CR=1 FL=1